MKIENLINCESFLYRYFFEKIYISTAFYFFIFYILSSIFSFIDFSQVKNIFGFLVEHRIQEFKKSNLQLNSRVEWFIFFSNFFIFLGSLILILFSSKENIKDDIIIDAKQRNNMIKILFIVVAMLLLFAVSIFITPFSENIWGYFFYYNEIAYFLSVSFLFSCVFLYLYSICIYVKFLFLKKGE